LSEILRYVQKEPGIESQYNCVPVGPKSRLFKLYQLCIR